MQLGEPYRSLLPILEQMYTLWITVKRGTQQRSSASAPVVFTGLTRPHPSLKALSAEAPTAKTLVCDIGDSGVADDIRAWAPNPTLAVHAAAIFRDSSFLDLTVESFDESMRANARGSFLFLQIAAQMMKEEGKGGSIVNLSTQGSKVGLRNHFAYCASKGALDQMTRVMAMELAEFGIRTNSVHPTVTKTSMGSYWTGDRKQNMIDRIPLGRFNEIDDIVWPVLYLLSDASTTVNGDTMMIDGGFFAAPWGQGQE